MSALFIVFALMTLSTFFWAKLNVRIILHVLFFSLLSLSVAVGLLKRYQWARWLAMASMTIGLANSMVGGYKDIQLMATHYPDVPIFVFWLVGAPLWTVIALAIWWLSKSSTKLLFNSKA